MSTKAIRNFIDEAGDRCPELRDAALAEVEAIERAAKAWWDDNSRRHSLSMTTEHEATLESITKDAP